MIDGSAKKRASVHGADIEYTISGRGRALLFLHGGDGPVRSAAAVTSLAEYFEVIYPSHPGFGSSGLPQHLTTVDDLSYVYLDFLRKLDRKDVLVVGVSFGGWIAAELAVKSPPSVSGLVVSGAFGARFAPPHVPEIFDLFSVPAYEQAKWLYNAADLQDPDYKSLPDEQLLEVAGNHASFGLFGWSPTLHSRKLRDRLPLISVPTLVLWGEEDRVAGTQYGRAYASAIEGARFKTLPGCGHYSHVEDPQSFVEAVRSFAAEHAAPRELMVQ